VIRVAALGLGVLGDPQVGPSDVVAGVLCRDTVLYHPVEVSLHDGVHWTHQAGRYHHLCHDVLAVTVDAASERHENLFDDVRLGHQEAGSVMGGDRGEADHLEDVGEGQGGEEGELGEVGGGNQRD